MRNFSLANRAACTRYAIRCFFHATSHLRTAFWRVCGWLKIRSPIACQRAAQARNRAEIMLDLNDTLRIEDRILRKTRASRKKATRIGNYPAISDFVIRALRPMTMNP